VGNAHLIADLINLFTSQIIYENSKMALVAGFGQDSLLERTILTKTPYSNYLILTNLLKKPYKHYRNTIMT